MSDKFMIHGKLVWNYCWRGIEEVIAKESKMEHHTSNYIMHMVPEVKKNELNDYLAWNDATNALFWLLIVVAIHGKKMQYVLNTLWNQDDLLGLDPSNEWRLKF